MIEGQGGELVVFFNAAPELVESWRAQDARIPDDLAVVADAGAGLYEALGTARRQNPLELVPGSIGPLFGAAARGHLPKLTRADMLRLGADVAVGPDGEIARLHRARHPADRIALPDLVAALVEA